MTAGDVDADWEDAYAVGDEAPGRRQPDPDQDRVDDIGKALGVEYQDNEELKASEKITERDRHRWELDPASSEDYPDEGLEGFPLPASRCPLPASGPDDAGSGRLFAPTAP